MREITLGRCRAGRSDEDTISIWGRRSRGADAGARDPGPTFTARLADAGPAADDLEDLEKVLEAEIRSPKSKKRRQHSPDLKAKVGLEALKGIEPVNLWLTSARPRRARPGS